MFGGEKEVNGNKKLRREVDLLSCIRTYINTAACTYVYFF